MSIMRKACFLVFATTAVAWADTLTLLDGSVLDGKVAVDEVRLSVQLSGFGDLPDLTIPLEMVASINGTPVKIDPARWFEKQFSEVDLGDIGALRKLASWCALKGLPAQQKQVLEQVVSLDPGDEQAHLLLAHARYNGEWMSEEDLKENGLAGLRRCGAEWVTVQEMALRMQKGKVKTSDDVMREAGMVRVNQQWHRPEDLLGQGYLFVNGRWGRALIISQEALTKVVMHPKLALPDQATISRMEDAGRIASCLELRECLLRGAVEGLNIPERLAAENRETWLQTNPSNRLVTSLREEPSSYELLVRLVRDNDTLAILDVLYLTDAQTAALFNVSYQTNFVDRTAAKKALKVLNANQLEVLRNYMGYGGVPPADVLDPPRVGQASTASSGGRPTVPPTAECFCYEQQLEELTKVPDDKLKEAVSEFVNNNYLPVIKGRYPEIARELSKKKEYVVTTITETIRRHKTSPIKGDSFG